MAVASFLFGGIGSPEDVAKTFIEGMKELDAGAIMEIIPPTSDENKDRDEMKEQLEQSFEMAGSMGKEMIKGLEFEIGEVTYCSKDEIEDIRDEIGDEIDGKITDAATVEVTMTIMGMSQPINIGCIEVGGDWYVNPESMDSMPL